MILFVDGNNTYHTIYVDDIKYETHLIPLKQMLKIWELMNMLYKHLLITDLVILYAFYLFYYSKCDMSCLKKL